MRKTGSRIDKGKPELSREVGYAADLELQLLCILSIACDLAIQVRDFDVPRILLDTRHARRIAKADPKSLLGALHKEYSKDGPAP